MKNGKFKGSLMTLIDRISEFNVFFTPYSDYYHFTAVKIIQSYHDVIGFLKM